MAKVKTETVEVLGYGDVRITDTILCVKIDFVDEETGNRVELVMYPEESKALRKAMKRAEGRVADGRTVAW